MATPDRRDSDDRSPASEAVDALRRWVERRAVSELRRVAFWAAVVLPFAVLAVLATGLESTTDWWLFGALVASNAVSLYVGHTYQSE